MTNTNWQVYAGESTMSQLSQMLALVVQQFLSAAVGMAVGVALIRGITRKRRTTLGSFWVDTGLEPRPASCCPSASCSPSCSCPRA